MLVTVIRKMYCTRMRLPWYYRYTEHMFYPCFPLEKPRKGCERRIVLR
jgi:hypothetical protein